MKIATWNVERLKHKLDEIIYSCEQTKADILVLTETDQRIELNYKNCFHTSMVSEIQPKNYKNTENRVSIYTNYKCIHQYATFDKYTAICIELETAMGNLLVYGTIIGNYGNRHPSFMQDLRKQAMDFKRLSQNGNSLCICGDYNCSFEDNYYYTKAGRNIIYQSFFENRIKLLTEKTKECIDHIAISDKFITSNNISIEEWNQNKKLSDHKGISVNF